MLFLIVGCPGSWWSNLEGHCNCNWKRLYQETRDGSRTAASSKMERFVMIVNGWKALTIITKCSILDVAAVLDPLLETSWIQFDPYQPRNIQLGKKPLQENGLRSTDGYDRESRNIRRSAKGRWSNLFTFDLFHYWEQQNTKVNGDKSRPNSIKIYPRLQ